MERYVRVEREGALLIVTLDHADKHNAFHPDVHQQLEEIWNDYFADASLRVAILMGAGDKAFCAGSDLSAYASPQQGPVKLAMPQHGYAGLTHRFGTAKPIIAAVNGLALGGGIPRLCRKLPYTIAMTLLLTGDRLSAADALRLGLVSEVVEQGQAVNAAKRLAQRILRGGLLWQAPARLAGALTSVFAQRFKGRGTRQILLAVPDQCAAD
jgi:enoyl-CoA hydratase/carnithine racemase